MWKTSRFYIAILLIFFFGHFGLGQEKPTISLTVVLNEIEDTHNVLFNYESELFDKNIQILFNKDLNLDDLLEDLSRQTQLIFSRIGNRIIAVYKPYSVCGYVRNLDTGDILSGATIVGKNFQTITDDKGYFKIDVASPNSVVTIRHIGFKPVKIHVIDLGLEGCKTLWMEEQLDQLSPIILTSYIVRGINKLNSGETQINFSKFSLLPGMIDTDVLHSLQALPGVQSTDDTVANINVRGGAHDQNLIMWDGVKMYQSGHFFGLISSFHPQITQTVSFVKNGTDASFSGGVSGIIHLNSSEKFSKRLQGNLGMSLLSTDAFVEVPVGEKAEFQLALRKSSNHFKGATTYRKYFDRITQQTEVALNESNVDNLNKNFGFSDIALRGLYAPSKKDFFRWNLLWINNNLTFDERTLIENERSSRTSRLSQKSLAGGLYYKRTWNTKWTTDFSVYETDYFLTGENANVIDQQRFLQENKVSETGIKSISTYKPNSKWVIVSGYQFKETGITNLNDIDSPRFRRLNTEVIRTHGLFGQLQFTSYEMRSSIVAGFRGNYIDPLNVVFFEPRLRIFHSINQNLKVTLMGEMKHQYTSQIINFQNDFLGIEKRRWQLSNNQDIPLMKSKQVSLDMTYEFMGWLVDMSGYFKKIDGITAQSQEFTTKFEFEKSIGKYQVKGIDVLVRKRFANMSSWIGYSAMDNNYMFPSLEANAFPSNFNISHHVNWGATYSKGGLKISVGTKWHTGRPTSVPVTGEEVLGQQVNFGPANSNRTNDYLRIDASLVYRKKITNDFDVEIGTSIWNMSGYQNEINRFYRISNTGDVQRFERFSLGTTQNFVIRLFF